MHVRVPTAACARVRSLLASNVALLHAVRALARPHAQLLRKRVPVVRPGPSRMALPVRVPAAELRACVQGSCSVQGHVF